MNNTPMLFGAARKSHEDRIARDALRIASEPDENDLDLQRGIDQFSFYASIAKSSCAITLYAIPTILLAVIAVKLIIWILSL